MADWILKGKYLMGDVIGSGGMAMVYKATRLDTGETVAVKMLRSEYVEDASYVRQFNREAQICMEHHHRNIVDTIDAGEEDGRLFIVMEYVPGQTLKEHIQKHKVLNHEEIVDIGVEICEALYYAHCQQLVHRDIKPQNIMLTANHTAKVADFGIARSAALSTITMGGDKVMGSVHYFSPEQARGGFTDRKTDLYSLGIVLYEMATGTLPFQGDTAVSVAIKQLQEKPVPPSQINPKISRALEDIILKAIEKDPRCRYDSARELSNDLMKSLRNPDGHFVRKVTVPVHEEGETLRVPRVHRENVGQENFTARKTGAGSGAARIKKTRRRGLSTGSVVLISFLVLLLVVMAVGAAYLVGRIQDERAAVRVVPDVIGYTSNEAQMIFDQAQLIVLTKQEPSELQPAGRVVRCEPGVGTTVDTSTTITMYVSLGSEKIAVPDLSGIPLEEAEALLEEKGLVLGDVRQSASKDTPNSHVLQQDPEADSLLNKGDKVDLWIAQNENQAHRMENYVGMKEQEATMALEDLGLVLEGITRMESHEPVGTVLQQDPVEGTEVVPGTGIKLWISKGVSETTAVEAEGENAGKEITILVEEESSRIQIQMIAGEATYMLVDEIRENGSYSYHIAPIEDIAGTQIAIIWIDDAEAQRVVIVDE